MKILFVPIKHKNEEHFHSQVAATFQGTHMAITTTTLLNFFVKYSTSTSTSTSFKP
jgi:hypothetical protein